MFSLTSPILSFADLAWNKLIVTTQNLSNQIKVD